MSIKNICSYDIKPSFGNVTIIQVRHAIRNAKVEQNTYNNYFMVILRSSIICDSY